MNFMANYLLVLSFMTLIHTQNILAKVDFTNGLTYTYSYMYNNFIGLSIDFNDLFPYLTDPNL